MKLGIQPLLPIGNYLNKRYFIEMDFPNDSHPVENFKYLNETIMAIHMAEFPMFYKEGKPLFLPQSASYSGEDVKQDAAQIEEQVVQVDNKPNPIESMITAITTCTEVAVLKTFEKLAKSKPEFQEAYDNTLKKLQNV